MDQQQVVSIHESASRSESKKFRSGKGISIQVKFLDDSVTGFRVQYKALGKWLLEQVCGMLSIIETDYFGLEYYDTRGTRYWLDVDKPMYRQLSLDLDHPVMYFGVKFYTPSVDKLEDELTRYLFVLQIKRDLSDGTLQCNESIAALIAAYIVQSQIGDYDQVAISCSDLDQDNNSNYLSGFNLIPHQDVSFENATADCHKTLIGLSQSETEFHLLQLVCQLDFYGVKLSPVKTISTDCDQDKKSSSSPSSGLNMSIAANHVGILVFQNFNSISTFNWNQIRKLSFKRKKFLMKLHDNQVIEFLFETRNESKNFWKKCIEQHTFFKCSQSKIKSTKETKSKILARGSSFRYSGRTQAQVLEYVRSNIVKRQPFQRSTSFRSSVQVPASSKNVVVPIPPHHFCGATDDEDNDLPHDDDIEDNDDEQDSNLCQAGSSGTFTRRSLKGEQQRHSRLEEEQYLARASATSTFTASGATSQRTRHFSGLQGTQTDSSSLIPLDTSPTSFNVSKPSELEKADLEHESRSLLELEKTEIENPDTKESNFKVALKQKERESQTGIMLQSNHGEKEKEEEGREKEDGKGEIDEGEKETEKEEEEREKESICSKTENDVLRTENNDVEERTKDGDGKITKDEGGEITKDEDEEIDNRERRESSRTLEFQATFSDVDCLIKDPKCSCFISSVVENLICEAAKVAREKEKEREEEEEKQREKKEEEEEKERKQREKEEERERKVDERENDADAEDGDDETLNSKRGKKKITDQRSKMKIRYKESEIRIKDKECEISQSDNKERGRKKKHRSRNEFTKSLFGRCPSVTSRSGSKIGIKDKRSLSKDHNHDFDLPLIPLSQQLLYVSMRSLPSLDSYSYRDDTRDLDDPLDDLVSNRMRKMRKSSSSQSDNDQDQDNDQDKSNVKQRAVTDNELFNLTVSADLGDLNIDSETDFESMEFLSMRSLSGCGRDKDQDKKNLDRLDAVLVGDADTGGSTLSASLKAELNKKSLEKLKVDNLILISDLIIDHNLNDHYPDDLDQDNLIKYRNLDIQSSSSPLASPFVTHQTCSQFTDSASCSSSSYLDPKGSHFGAKTSFETIFPKVNLSDPSFLYYLVVNLHLNESHIF